MYKIEIKGSSEDLKRISIFLDNNHLKHNVVDDVTNSIELQELTESIHWPVEI